MSWYPVNLVQVLGEEITHYSVAMLDLYILPLLVHLGILFCLLHQILQVGYSLQFTLFLYSFLLFNKRAMTSNCSSTMELKTECQPCLLQGSQLPCLGCTGGSKSLKALIVMSFMTICSPIHLAFFSRVLDKQKRKILVNDLHKIYLMHTNTNASVTISCSLVHLATILLALHMIGQQGSGQWIEFSL